MVQRPKLVEEGGGQRRTGTRRRGIIEQRPGYILQFCRPAIGRGRDVETQAQHRIVQHAAFHVQRGFGQDAADLAAIPPEVVDPLDAQFRTGNLLSGAAGGHGGHSGQADSLAQADLRPQQDAEVQPALGREEAVPTPAAPGRLCLGDQHQPFGGTILSAGPQSSIRAGQTIDDLDLQGSGRFWGQQRRDGGGIEHVGSRGEDVAAVGHRRHRDAVGPQGSDGFPPSCCASSCPEMYLPRAASSAASTSAFTMAQLSFQPNCHSV